MTMGDKITREIGAVSDGDTRLSVSFAVDEHGRAEVLFLVHHPTDERRKAYLLNMNEARYAQFRALLLGVEQAAQEMRARGVMR